MRFFALFLVCLPFTAFSAMKPSFGPDPSMFLGGDEGDSCQIIMCLSDPAGQDLEECEEPIRKWEETRPEERPKLLEKCPMVTGGGS
ncbi:hypothetical protein [Stutzerimonas stutzeri]|uniref:hypothetical protein n=1 Tax=Stutzerimonas stutzeri TaxID=316 RepID=UPI0015E422DF|nr:hypothetical protein [Stutzerimonas stutzeri]MBA1280198.1 hypothetical protein [Stutzerimonas stutzeri]